MPKNPFFNNGIRGFRQVVNIFPGVMANMQLNSQQLN